MFIRVTIVRCSLLRILPADVRTEFVAYQIYLRVDNLLGHPGNSPSGASPFLRILPSHPLSVSHLYHSCVGVIGGIFVYASLGLRVTDHVISVAGPDDSGSIAHRTIRTERPTLKRNRRPGPSALARATHSSAQADGRRVNHRFPDAPVLLLTLLPRYRLHFLVARHPVALADSPAPRQGSGSPRPVCTKLYRHWPAAHACDGGYASPVPGLGTHVSRLRRARRWVPLRVSPRRGTLRRRTTRDS